MKIFNSEENMKKWVYFAMIVLININTKGVNVQIYTTVYVYYGF